MALQTPPNIYSAGAVTVSSQPSVNLYAQVLARKQAREEALDAYEMNRINRMNEAGVRDIDRQGLDAKIIDMKTYYQANKDKIRKGGTPEAYNYEKMYRDTLAGVSKSKNATARAETFNKIRLERQKLGRNTPDDWFQEYTQHEDTPIWDETFQELDLPKYMSQNKKRFDQKQYLGLFKDVKRDKLTPRYEEVPGDKYGRNKFIDKEFSDDAKTQIRMLAENAFDADDAVVEQTNAMVQDPIRRGQLEKVFTEQYGTAPTSLKDYSTANALQQLQSKVTEKVGYEPLFAERQKLLQGYKQQNIATYNWYRQQDKANQDYFIDAIYDDNINEAARQNGSFNPSPFIKNKLGFLGKLPAKDFKIAPDGYIEFNDGQGAQRISPNTYKSHLRDEFTAKASTPQVQKAITKPTNSTYLINGKKYSEAELLKMGYTTDQIKPYKQ